jgi:N6-adenosine-specific RNA methylase IME4
VVPPDKDAPTLAELKLSKKRAARAQRLFAIPPATRKQYIDELKAEDRGVTPNAVLQKDRRHKKKEKVHAISTTAFSEDGPFDVVVIDPPWQVEKIDRDVRPNQDAFDYPTMSETELAAFWDKELIDKLASDVHVFCWATNKYLPVALHLIQNAWGLRYVLTMVWHKTGGFQPIGLPQYNCEFVIYARRGAPVFIDTKDFFCCFAGERREHSRKPDSFYDLIHRVTGGSRIDVFSRERRDGFAQYGNEVQKFAEAS